jgi:hypothetical protein
MGAFSSVLRDLIPPIPSLREKVLKTATESQKKLFAIFDDPSASPRVLWLGGKGSGKTYGAAAVVADYILHNPGTVGALVANTLNQISDAPLRCLVDLVVTGGGKPVPRSEIRIDGKVYRNVLVVQISEVLQSFVLIRSFENINTIEGVELDWAWIDEVQDVAFDDFKTLLSRVRGRRAVYDQMPERFLIATGLVTSKYRYHFTSDDALWTHRLMSSTLENEKNLPAEYVSLLQRIYSASEIEMFVHGRPIEEMSLLRVFDFKYDEHVLREPITFPPSDFFIVSVDFNPSPLYASVWCKLPDGRWLCFDEIEIWGATVYDFVEELHRRGYTKGIIIGDASANKRTLINSENEWDILSNELMGMTVIRGLVCRRTPSGTKYSNPPVFETISCANNLLSRRAVCFNPSKLENGGMPASLASITYEPATGTLDKTVDRSKDPKKPRTHPADTFRYFAYFIERRMVDREKEFDSVLNLYEYESRKKFYV